MTLRHLVPIVLVGVVLPLPGGADTLREALVKAYNTNPTLSASRAGLRATDETVPIARAAGLPSLGLTGSVVDNPFGSSNTLASPTRQATSGIQLSVPVFNAGSVRNSVRAAETRVLAGRATLQGTESDLFAAVVGAYMDVIRDEAIVGLNQQNLHVLDVNLQATRDRFQVGDLTRTDVAQSEARFSQAQSQLQQANADLISSRESYIRLVGTPPGALETPPVLPNLPGSSDLAVEAALHDSPSLLASQRNRDASAFDVDVARASRAPQVSVQLGGDYYNYLGSLGSGTNVRVGQAGTGATAGVSLSVPLFQAGRPAAEIRQAQERRGQAIEQVTETERAVIAQTRAAYAIWKSSQQVIQSSETAVDANKLSLEGVRAENSVGSRTILDILNAEQELLNSQVTLVSAQRDAYVAGFSLLAAMGRAQAKDLGLDGGALYDPLAHYNRDRHRIADFGSAPDPRPVATRTVGTPAQGAELTKPLDPILDTPVDTERHLTTGEHAPSR